jgi:hypothetical protein
VALSAGYSGLVGEQYLPVESKIRQRTLLKDKHILFTEAIVIVRAEDLSSLSMVQGAGHNIPRTSGIVFVGNGREGLCKDSKQRFVSDGADRKISLWTIKSKSGPLSAGYDQGSNLAG